MTHKMTISKENKLIPELRFPEFMNEGEWVLKEFGEIGDFIGGGTPDTTKAEYWSGNIQWYTPTEVKEGILKKSSRTITEEGLNNSSAKLLPKGALLITTRATIGDIAIANSECTTNQGFQSLVVIKSEENTFWYYWIIQHKDELKRKSSGSTFPEIGKNEIVKIKVSRPEKKEQQKIASCLTSLDEVIAAHSQKLELLKDHKKGLMQNLFPQEGESVPKYRFPEFENDVQWVEKPLKEVFSIFQGFAFSSTDSAPHGTRWLKIADVGIQQMKNDSPAYLPKSYKDQFQKFLVKKGDYVLALTRPILNMELKIAPVDDTFHDALLNQRVGKIVTNNNSSFVYYQLQIASMIANITRNITGNEPPNLSFQQIENILIYIPDTPEEQQKIASCLSSLDGLITAQVEKIEQLKLHKKGLMQGLFPKMND